MIVLNVGGGASRHLPPSYRDWKQELLDIDPAVHPDIVCDAKEMHTIKKKYDAVYCSHTLEHFYRHDVPRVLSGFLHVLNDKGFAHISVPDITSLMECMLKGHQDIEETWYVSPGGAISFHDVLYGWNKAMSGGNLYYAHKCGFTEKSLTKALRAAGFKKVFTASDSGNLFAYAFKVSASKQLMSMLGV